MFLMPISARKCASCFPGEYWRQRDRDNSYPADFVHALSERSSTSTPVWMQKLIDMRLKVEIWLPGKRNFGWSLCRVTAHFSAGFDLLSAWPRGGA
jgi:hypothetical protein